jgi:hypothetical protein
MSGIQSPHDTNVQLETHLSSGETKANKFLEAFRKVDKKPEGKCESSVPVYHYCIVFHTPLCPKACRTLSYLVYGKITPSRAG